MNKGHIKEIKESFHETPLVHWGVPVCDAMGTHTAALDSLAGYVRDSGKHWGQCLLLSEFQTQALTKEADGEWHLYRI